MTRVAAVLIAATRSVYGADSTTRGADFRMVVTQAVASATNAVPNADLVVIVAPEYFFSRFNPYGTVIDNTRSDIAPVSRSEKHGFYDDIVAASKAHPNVLIVGGTIFYSKTKGIIHKSRVALNVCPIAIGGKIKYKIYKQRDDLNAQYYDRDLTYKQKSGKSDPVFEEGGIRFSLDICADNGRALSFLGDGGEVDIHIMVSAGSRPDLPPNARYILHCDLSGHGQANTPGKAAASAGTFRNELDVTASHAMAQIDGMMYNVFDIAV